MGARANLVVKDRAGWALYYSHWAASRLDVDLLWGPEHARAFIESQLPQAQDEWLDTDWCEGAAVLDSEARSLLWCGGELVEYDVPLRRVYLDLMREIWVGWRVGWAVRGLVEIAETCGVPAEVVAVPPRRDGEWPWWGDENDSWMTGAITIARPGRIEVYPAFGVLSGDAPFPTPDEIERGMLGPPRDSFRFEEFPYAGIHVDHETQTLRLWAARPRPLIEDLVRQWWPGWTVINDGDRFEPQLSTSAGRLEVPGRREDDLLSAIVEHVNRVAAEDESGSEMRQGIAEAIAEQYPGSEITVSPMIDEHTPVPLVPAVREQMLGEALRRLRSRSAYAIGDDTRRPDLGPPATSPG